MRKKFLFSLVVLAAVLAILELTGRVLYKGVRVSDPLSGNIRNAKNFSILDDIAAIPSSKDDFRVLMLGGSMAYGWGASSAETRYSSLLEKNLNAHRSGRPWRVINGGVPDFEAVDELALYVDHLRKFKPQIIIALTGYNDLWDAVRYQLVANARPRLEKTFEHRAIAPADTAELRRAYLHGVAENVSGFLLRRSAFYAWITEHRRRQDYLPIKNLAAFDMARAEEDMGAFFNSLTALAAVAMENKSKLAVVIQPMRALSGVSQDELPLTRYEATMRRIYETVVKPRLPTLANERGFALYNLNDGFSAELVRKNAFIDFCHVNDEGNRLLADALEKIIAAESPVK